ncbi:hypothetical protein Dimus_037515 [Dionaea muscipula]
MAAVDGNGVITAAKLWAAATCCSLLLWCWSMMARWVSDEWSLSRVKKLGGSLLLFFSWRWSTMAAVVGDGVITAAKLWAAATCCSLLLWRWSMMARWAGDEWSLSG